MTTLTTVTNPKTGKPYTYDAAMDDATALFQVSAYHCVVFVLNSTELIQASGNWTNCRSCSKLRCHFSALFSVDGAMAITR